jgi:hypothetical protein
MATNIEPRHILPNAIVQARRYAFRTRKRGRLPSCTNSSPSMRDHEEKRLMFKVVVDKNGLQTSHVHALPIIVSDGSTSQTSGG